MNINLLQVIYATVIVLGAIETGCASFEAMFGFSNKTLRQATRVAAKLVYDHTKVDKLPSPWTQIQTAYHPIGKRVTLGTDKFTSSYHEIVDAFASGFDQGLSGCVYSLKHSDMRRAIIVAFPGSSTIVDWAKNVVANDSPMQNIQEYVWKDTNLLWKSDYQNILKTHIRSHREKISGDDDLDVYFVGHSRGGANAIVAGQLFQNIYVHYKKSIFGNIRSINVISYCSPRISNVDGGIFNNSKVNFINFVCPGDIVTYLPYNWTLNPGKIIPFRQKNYGVNLYHNHQLPTREEMENAVDAYPAARNPYPDSTAAWRLALHTYNTVKIGSFAYGVGSKVLGGLTKSQTPLDMDKSATRTSNSPIPLSTLDSPEKAEINSTEENSELLSQRFLLDVIQTQEHELPAIAAGLDIKLEKDDIAIDHGNSGGEDEEDFLEFVKDLTS